MPAVGMLSGHQVFTGSHADRIQGVGKAAVSLVAFDQPCHGGEVVNACWREGDVPSLEMAACLGRSGLRSHPVLALGAAGMGRSVRCLRAVRPNSLGDAPGDADGAGRSTASDRFVHHQHQQHRSPAGSVLCGDAALDDLGR